MVDKGQNKKEWSDFWKGLTPESEIRMWDFYGGRQWILKYTPRFGKVVEAGCGLGRYVFYLSKFGIDIEGLDFENNVIKYLNNWKVLNGFDNVPFIQGDVTQLPYDDNSLSGYISLGVVEHFREGPIKPISEAFRVLRPGGIAIITTPNKSFYIRYRDLIKRIKDVIKKLIGKKNFQDYFFQYEYSPKQLKRFCEAIGFYVSRAEGCDFLYVFNEIGNFTGNNLREDSLAYDISHLLEYTLFKYFAAQTITISIKTAPVMYCFLSGKFNAKIESLNKYDVPISDEMQKCPLAKFYLKGRLPKFACKYQIEPPLLLPKKKICEYSNIEYISDILFEDFGFTKNIAPDLLRKPEINIELANTSIRPIWRRRN